MLLSLLLSEVLTPFTYASEGEVVSESVEAPAQEAVAEEPVDEVVSEETDAAVLDNDWGKWDGEDVVENVEESFWEEWLTVVEESNNESNGEGNN